MKRMKSRKIRFAVEKDPFYDYLATDVPELHDDSYIGKHESLDGYMEELDWIIQEMIYDLDLTEEFMAEVMEKTANHLRKIAEKIHLRIPVMKLPVRKSMLEYICGKAVMPCVGMV